MSDTRPHYDVIDTLQDLHCKNGFYLLNNVLFTIFNFVLFLVIYHADSVEVYIVDGVSRPQVLPVYWEPTEEREAPGFVAAEDVVTQPNGDDTESTEGTPKAADAP